MRLLFLASSLKGTLERRPTLCAFYKKLTIDYRRNSKKRAFNVKYKQEIL